MSALALLRLVFAILLLAHAPRPALAGTPVAAADAADRLAEVLPAFRDAVARDAGDRLAAYDIRAAADPARGTIGGSLVVDYPNEVGAPLSEVWFRLFPNIPYYGEGDLSVGGVTVDGEPAPVGFDLDGSAMRVDLPSPLPPGGTARIAMEFETVVPADSRGSYGILQRDTDGGAWILSDWHPVLAVHDPGAGWNLAPATPAGDPTYAASAWFDVRLAHPAAWTAVASGVRVEELAADGNAVESRFVAGPAREFTLALGDRWQPVAVERDGVAVTSWTDPATIDPAAARRAAETAADALAALGEKLGPYPYRELDLVQAPLDGALAVSWAGLILLDADSLLDWYAEEDPGAFDTVVAHEVAHLWWGSAVGSDSNASPFVNEGLATVTSVGYLEWTGDPALADAVETWIAAPARQLLQRGDAVVDLPAGAGDPSMRTWAVYAKGALGFLAIREAIGDEAFWGALRNLATEERFAIVRPEDVLAAFERESGEDLGPLWDEWFRETRLSEAAIESAVASLGG